MALTKAIRLSASEMDSISEFLRQNPFFDFSSLARTAILNFIQNPTVSIRPLVRPVGSVEKEQIGD